MQERPVAVSAGERVHAVPELRRRILQYLDKPSLCIALRTGRQLFATATLLLYRNITHDVAQSIQPGPREDAYLSAVREIDAADEVLLRPWTTLEERQFMTHEHLDHLRARFPHVHTMKRVPPVFYDYASWRIDFRKKHILMQTLFSIRPRHASAPPPLVDSHRWKGWDVEQTLKVSIEGLCDEFSMATILQRLQGEDIRHCVTYANMDPLPITLPYLCDICCVSTALHTICCLGELQPFTLDDWSDFFAKATNVRFISLDSLYIKLDDIEAIIPEMIEKVKQSSSLQLLLLVLHVFEDQETTSRRTLDLRMERDNDGQLQICKFEHDPFKELRFTPEITWAQTYVT